MAKRKTNSSTSKGKLRIGDMWNAITIIALSQNDPLKAVAEFVENSIDAGARNIVIVRGKEKGKPYLRVNDDGHGIPHTDEGIPDFKYVATHVCDSIKRRMKAEGAQGIQGEFGIGLLSFWTVGEELVLSSHGSDGCTYEMHMAREKPGYEVYKRRILLPEEGTQLKVHPLLPGIRQLSGEKIQWYLASELRDRIRSSGVRIKVVDRQARKELEVEPRQFAGRLIHELPRVSTSLGDVYLELYITQHNPENRVGLYRSGTRVLSSISMLSQFEREPWASGCLEGIIDAPFLRLTPGSRTGIIHDEAFSQFCAALEPVEEELCRLIEEQRRAEEQRASRQVLKSVQRAIREALLALPEEEYDWFDVRSRSSRKPLGAGVKKEVEEPGEKAVGEGIEVSGGEPAQKQFFEYEGPLHSVKIVPKSSVVSVEGQKSLRVVPVDRKGQLVEKNLTFLWRIVEGEGRLHNSTGECAVYIAPAEPGLANVEVIVRQDEVECRAEAFLTVTDELLPQSRQSGEGRNKGLPGYTFRRAPGELWRSRYDNEKNIVVINNGHRDFVYASRNKARKLRYICRLFSKELILKNFPGISPDRLLERMIELSMYTEENLR